MVGTSKYEYEVPTPVAPTAQSDACFTTPY